MAEIKADIATFYGVEALVEAAKECAQGPFKDMTNSRNDYGGSRDEWAGASFKEALELCSKGWQTDLQETLDLVESAVSTVEAELPSTHFLTQYGVEGCDVDVDRYLSGEPESMISYPLHTTPRVGRVITLSASICYSAGYSAEQIKARGRLLCALVMALSRMSITTELWVEAGCGQRSSGLSAVRCLLKGANDTLDESKIMFMYAHPAALRRIMFTAAGKIPNVKKHGGADGSSYWSNAPGQVIKNLPEGTIYLPEISLYDNIKSPEDELRRILKDIGIVEESHS